MLLTFKKFCEGFLRFIFLNSFTRQLVRPHLMSTVDHSKNRSCLCYKCQFLCGCIFFSSSLNLYFPLELRKDPRGMPVMVAQSPDRMLQYASIFLFVGLSHEPVRVPIMEAIFVSNSNSCRDKNPDI